MKPIVLTIAGFDPSSGAGLSADLKTFERNGVYGLAVCTANTVQTHDRFESVNWIDSELVLKQLDALIAAYQISAVKIGIISDAHLLSAVLKRVDQVAKIVWDPVIKPSAGGKLHTEAIATWLTPDLLEGISIITPNASEIEDLAQGDLAQGLTQVDNYGSDLREVLSAITLSPRAINLALNLSSHCAVLIKSAHVEGGLVSDLLFSAGRVSKISGSHSRVYPKHGSGCVFSSVIASYLARGVNLVDACAAAKLYTEEYLRSNESLVGYHP